MVGPELNRFVIERKLIIYKYYLNNSFHKCFKCLLNETLYINPTIVVPVDLAFGSVSPWFVKTAFLIINEKIEYTWFNWKLYFMDAIFYIFGQRISFGDDLHYRQIIYLKSHLNISKNIQKSSNLLQLSKENPPVGISSSVPAILISFLYF